MLEKVTEVHVLPPHLVALLETAKRLEAMYLALPEGTADSLRVMWAANNLRDVVARNL